MEELVSKCDKSGMFALLTGFPDQCREAVRLSREVALPAGYKNVDRIVVAGMGGSAIAGDVLCNCTAGELGVPVFVLRNYDLPEFINKKTLFIAMSYSGNTEETLASYRKACLRSARVFAVTSGGELEQMCRKNKTPVVKIPAGMPPRTAIGYLFFPLLVQLEKSGFLRRISPSIKETLETAEKMSAALSAEGNAALAISKKLYGKLPVIYGSDRLSSAVLRWRTQINENSKMLALTGILPEMNHNEIVGWDGPKKVTENSQVIILRDSRDNERVQKRIEITRALVEDACSGVEEVWAEGKSVTARIISLIYFGDFVSFYLAALNRIDPTPVKRIDLLKERLKET